MRASEVAAVACIQAGILLEVYIPYNAEGFFERGLMRLWGISSHEELEKRIVLQYKTRPQELKATLERLMKEWEASKPVTRGFPETCEGRELLLDVVNEEDTVSVTAELPGLEISDIRLDATEVTLTISVDTTNRRYHRRVVLPARVNPRSIRSAYKNGVLEVCLARSR